MTDSTQAILLLAVDELLDIVADFEAEGYQLNSEQITKLRNAEEAFTHAGGKLPTGFADNG